MKPAKFFVFDFDGVLFNTSRECLQLAFLTSKKYPFAEIWAGNVVPPPEVAETFLKLRYLVGPPWQYAVLLEAIARNDLPKSTEDFLSRAAQKAKKYENFSAEYFETRKELGRELWGFIQPVKEACALFLKLLGESRAQILSTRNAESIKVLFKHFFGVALPNGAILPLPIGQEKAQVLEQVAAGKGLANGEVFFIDDYVPHLEPAVRRGFNAVLATWGYLGPEDAKTALKMGLPCVDLDQLPHFIGVKA